MSVEVSVKVEVTGLGLVEVTVLGRIELASYAGVDVLLRGLKRDSQIPIQAHW